jgi:hypothetical protein
LQLNIAFSSHIGRAFALLERVQRLIQFQRPEFRGLV